MFEKYLSFKCRKQWAGLTPTDDSSIRHCGDCDKRVHWCDSDAKLATLSAAGACVALDPKYVETRVPVLGQSIEPEFLPKCSEHQRADDLAVPQVDQRTLFD
jgi:hypothetical protein